MHPQTMKGIAEREKQYPFNIFPSSYFSLFLSHNSLLSHSLDQFTLIILFEK